MTARGRIDDYSRVLVPIAVNKPGTAQSLSLEAWIDTGFTGSLLLTATQITDLGLVLSAVVPGSLVHGPQVLFETYTCEAEWLGQRRIVEALRGSGQFALVGLRLLEECRVLIDYPARTVEIARASSDDAL